MFLGLEVVWESSAILWDFPLLMTSAFLPCGKKKIIFFKDSARNALGKGCWELVSWLISLGPESCPQAPQVDGQGGLGRCHPLPRWEVDEMGPSSSHQASSSHLGLLFPPRAYRDSCNLGRTHFSFRFSFSRLLPGHQLPSVASWTVDISNMSWGSEGLHYRL